MERLTVYLTEEFHATIKDGEVIDWQPLTIKEVNGNIDGCINYLNSIKEAINNSKDSLK